MSTSSEELIKSKLINAEKKLQSTDSHEFEAGLGMLLDLLSAEPNNRDIYGVILRTAISKPVIEELLITRLEELDGQGNVLAHKAIEILNFQKTDRIDSSGWKNTRNEKLLKMEEERLNNEILREKKLIEIREAEVILLGLRAKKEKIETDQILAVIDKIEEERKGIKLANDAARAKRKLKTQGVAIKIIEILAPNLSKEQKLACLEKLLSLEV